MANPVKIIETNLLSDNWYKLYKYKFEITNASGNTQTQFREAYDRGNGAVILLYHRRNKTIILTRQFRLPTFINGNVDGMMIEACAGLLDEDNPEDCIRRETEEETGYRITHVQKIYEAYMSPGAVTEMLHFFVGEYEEGQRIHAGGGVAHEQENIEVLELPFDKAYDMIQSGEIRDAKTIMLMQYAKLHQLP